MISCFLYGEIYCGNMLGIEGHFFYTEGVDRETLRILFTQGQILEEGRASLFETPPMKKGKYIIGEIRDGTLRVRAAVAFPEYVDHVRLKYVFIENTIQSAGFFKIGEDLSVTTYGESMTLKVASQVSDAELIKKALGLDR